MALPDNLIGCYVAAFLNLKIYAKAPAMNDADGTTMLTKHRALEMSCCVLLYAVCQCPVTSSSWRAVSDVERHDFQKSSRLSGNDVSSVVYRNGQNGEIGMKVSQTVSCMSMDGMSIWILWCC